MAGCFPVFLFSDRLRIVVLWPLPHKVAGMNAEGQRCTEGMVFCVDAY